MMRVKTALVLIIMMCVTLSGCSNSSESLENTDEKEVKVEDNNVSSISEVKAETTYEEKLDHLKLESSRLRGGGSIKKVELTDGKAKISYVKDFNEYKKVNPQSHVTKENLEAYWESGDAIKKALIDGSVRIMKKLSYINQVQILLPYRGTNYSIDVQKDKLENFLGSDFNEIINNWDGRFSDPYVYNEEGREKFFKKFGKISK